MSEPKAANGLDLERAAEVAVAAALAAGADQADAWCEDSVDRTVRVYGGAGESVLEAGSRGAGVRVFKGRRSGYAYGSDLSEQGLRELASAATGAAAASRWMPAYSSGSVTAAPPVAARARSRSPCSLRSEPYA